MEIFKLFARDKVGVFFGCLMLAFFIVAATAQWITPYDPYATRLSDAFAWPSLKHIFGTDQFGRDVLSRTIIGTQITIKISGAAILVALILGVPLGMYAGFIRGKVEAILMRLTDIMIIFPTIILAIIIIAIVGPSENGIIIALGVRLTPEFMRITRGVTLSVKEEMFVEASVALGSSRLHILWRHIWPNISTPVVVQATLTLPVLVIAASSLSFLGLGVQPPTPEWGLMLNESKDFFRTAPYLIMGPGIALLLFVLASNLLGDSIREAANPRLREKR